MHIGTRIEGIFFSSQKMSLYHKSIAHKSTFLIFLLNEKIGHWIYLELCN